MTSGFTQTMLNIIDYPKEEEKEIPLRLSLSF